MFKIRNEVKIALLAVVALALGFWGFKFLKGLNVLSSSKTLYVKYDNVDQLRPSNPIFIKGFQVGMVKDMYIDKSDDKTIIAVLNIEGDVDIPKDAVAIIVGQSLMGGKAVELLINHPCDGDDCAQTGDYLIGGSKSFLQGLIGDPKQIDAYTDRLKKGLTINIDSLARANPEGMAASLNALDNSLKNIEKITEQVGRLLAATNASFVLTAQNAAAMTSTLRGSEKDITTTIANLSALSQQLRDAGLDQTSKKAASAIDSVTMSLRALRSTLSTTTGTLNRVDTLAQNLVRGKGLAGKVLTDEQLYDNLTNSTRQLQLLVQDLRLNPGRYTHIKLFGKGKKYSTSDDPADDIPVDSTKQK